MGHSTERIDWRQEAFNMMDEGRVTADFMAAMLIQWLTSDDIYECLDANELTPRFFGDVE